MKCSICNEEIEKRFHNDKMVWDQGNNAEPVVKNGRCCDACNAEVVIPVRMGGSRAVYVEARRLKVGSGYNKALDQNLRGTRK